jgi:5-(carboxyamino)imidazole ribonucleotide mutase
MPLVGIVIGSKSDGPLIQEMLGILSQLGIEYEVRVLSAHRNPKAVREYGSKAQTRGIEVIIAAAGLAAHLPGAIAASTTIPVIGVPLAVGELKGIDALLSMVQMPSGVPVATVGIGDSGLKNAAFIAARILGLNHENYRQVLAEK